MAAKLTDKQRRIMSYLSICSMPQMPTEIGEACGQPYHRASSWATSGMKSLIANGAIIRGDGPYYELTPAGRSALTEGRKNE